MKKKYFLLLWSMLACYCLFAQKKPLDFSACTSWPVFYNYCISNNGQYACYSVGENHSEDIVLTSLSNAWEQKFYGGYHFDFTPDNRFFLVQSGDTVHTMNMENKEEHDLLHVQSYAISKTVASPWVICQSKKVQQQLIAYNLETKEEQEFQGVVDFMLDPRGETLIINKMDSTDKDSVNTIKWVNLSQKKMQILCQTKGVQSLTVDGSGNRLVFVVNKKINGINEPAIEYFKQGMDSAKVLVQSGVADMKGYVISEEAISFSKDGSKLFFYTRHKNAENDSVVKKSSASFLIKGPGDEKLAIGYANSVNPEFSVIDLNSKDIRVIMPLHGLDKNPVRNFTDDGDWIIAESGMTGLINEYKWRKNALPNIYLISAKDGSQRLLSERLFYHELLFSPQGKYVVWFDRRKGQWFSHDISKNTTKDLTGKIPVPFFEVDDQSGGVLPSGYGGWMKNDEAFIVYDRNDIWQLDPKGIKKPVNITHGYGAKNKMRFRFPDFYIKNSISQMLGIIPKPISPDDSLYLSAFNLNTKDEGFYKLRLHDQSIRKLCSSKTSYLIKGATLNGIHVPGRILKARDRDVYIGLKMSATEYPNLYVTTNFENFKAISDFHPQKEYNWYTTELVKWNQLDGKPSQGILYKPENFDPKKKYPVLIHYYEKNSEALNCFLIPELSCGTISISWFVSNGYIVFVPDIYYKVGYPGRGAYNAVVSAALMLSKKTWIDANRMGIQGHSYGGFETNYIVSHTSIFAAAAPAAGPTNMISAWGAIPDTYGAPFFENKQGRMGYALWDRPDIYMENSAFFKVKNVTTPLLIIHGRHDYTVPYLQSATWYEALSRLGKKAWLLTYDTGHTIDTKEDELDLSIRMGQFFDHYLKGAPAPKWMTTGIKPESGDDGLELDFSGKQP